MKQTIEEDKTINLTVNVYTRPHIHAHMLTERKGGRGAGATGGQGVLWIDFTHSIAHEIISQPTSANKIKQKKKSYHNVNVNVRTLILSGNKIDRIVSQRKRKNLTNSCLFQPVFRVVGALVAARARNDRSVTVAGAAGLLVRRVSEDVRKAKGLTFLRFAHTCIHMNSKRCIYHSKHKY